MFLDSNEVQQELHKTKITLLSDLSAEELNNLFSSDIQNNNKIESTERTIDMLKSRISEFMLSSDNAKIPTQAGTAYFTKRTKEVYPDDNALIEFSKQNKLEMTIKLSPNKKIIKNHIKNGGSVPEGYSTHEVTTLSIRS